MTEVDAAIDAILAHHGVKGMKWGVRKEDSGGSSGGASSDVAGINARTKEYMAVPSSTNRTPKQAASELAKNEAKFRAKFNLPPDGPSDNASGVATPKKGLTPEQKKFLVKVGIATVAVGGLYAYGKYLNNQEALANAQIKMFAGRAIDVGKFTDHMGASKLKTWGFGGYLQPDSYTRPEFTLPAGHLFHRLSGVDEDGFNPGTYATHNLEDFHRYVAGFRNEVFGSELKHITFKATEDIKVPNLTTVLDSMQEVLKETGKYSSAAVAKVEYEKLSGGPWKDERSLSLFSKLAAKGYGAIVDEMDAGVIGESPVVVFSKGVSSKVSEKLTFEAMDKAERSLVELANRKL